MHSLGTEKEIKGQPLTHFHLEKIAIKTVCMDT